MGRYDDIINESREAAAKQARSQAESLAREDIDRQRLWTEATKQAEPVVAWFAALGQEVAGALRNNRVSRSLEVRTSMFFSDYYWYLDDVNYHARYLLSFEGRWFDFKKYSEWPKERKVEPLDLSVASDPSIALAYGYIPLNCGLYVNDGVLGYLADQRMYDDGLSSGEYTISGHIDEDKGVIGGGFKPIEPQIQKAVESLARRR